MLRSECLEHSRKVSDCEPTPGLQQIDSRIASKAPVRDGRRASKGCNRVQSLHFALWAHQLIDAHHAIRCGRLAVSLGLIGSALSPDFNRPSQFLFSKARPHRSRSYRAETRSRRIVSCKASSHGLGNAAISCADRDPHFALGFVEGLTQLGGQATRHGSSGRAMR